MNNKTVYNLFETVTSSNENNTNYKKTVDTCPNEKDCGGDDLKTLISRYNDLLTYIKK